MAENHEVKNTDAAGGGDFRSLFEESLQTVKPGAVVKGTVVGINETHVMVDVGYKSEGQIPRAEFLSRDGELEVKVGDEVDVFFDSEGENGGIVLSRQKAESIKIWERIEKAYQEGSAIEGTIVGRVQVFARHVIWTSSSVRKSDSSSSSITGCGATWSSRGAI
jgi:small subunit ribosomal protein S1